MSLAEFRQALARWFEPKPDPVEAMETSITLKYPFPIAMAYVLVWQELEWATRFSRLMDVFEATLKYCSSIAFLAARRAERFTAEVLETLARPQLGHWARYLDIASRAAESEQSQLCQRLRDSYLGSQSRRERSLDIVNHGVEVRNRFKHGGTHTESVYRGAYEDLLPRVHALLQSLDFLTEFPLARVKKMQFLNNELVVDYHSCMGALPVFRLQRTVVSRPVEDGRLGVLEPGPGEFLDLTPLLSMRTCPICGDEEMVYYYSMQGAKKLKFLSYQKGHLFDAELPTDPFAALGITW